MSPDNPQRPRWRTWLGRAGFVALLLAVFFGVRLYQQRSLVEGPAPALRAPLLDGTVVDLAGERGRPVLVHFWASWCPVCRLEEGAIETLSRDQRVITIALQSGSPAEVSKYLRDRKRQFAVVNDPDGAVAAAWGVRATPTSFVIDSEGMIRFREVGYTSGPGLRARLWLAR